jgi:hypothetical protein
MFMIKDLKKSARALTTEDPSEDGVPIARTSKASNGKGVLKAR